MRVRPHESAAPCVMRARLPRPAGAAVPRDVSPGVPCLDGLTRIGGWTVAPPPAIPRKGDDAHPAQDPVPAHRQSRRPGRSLLPPVRRRSQTHHPLSRLRRDLQGPRPLRAAVLRPPEVPVAGQGGGDPEVVGRADERELHRAARARLRGRQRHDGRGAEELGHLAARRRRHHSRGAHGDRTRPTGPLRRLLRGRLLRPLHGTARGAGDLVVRLPDDRGGARLRGHSSARVPRGVQRHPIAGLGRVQHQGVVLQPRGSVGLLEDDPAADPVEVPRLVSPRAVPAPAVDPGRAAGSVSTAHPFRHKMDTRRHRPQEGHRWRDTFAN